jgi:hypothetical protein
MKKTLIIISVLMAFTTHSYASPVSQQWNKTYGDISIDVSTDIYQTLDGGYILAGFTDSFGVSIAGFGILAVKLNSNGEVQWQKVYKVNNYFDIVYSFKQTADGGYILAGFTFPPTSTAMALILKLDGQGNVVWNRIYNEVTEFKSIQQTLDAGYIVCGNNYILKLTSAGDVSWNYCVVSTYENPVELDRIQQTTDGGYVASEYLKHNQQKDVFVLKFDGDGNMVWQKAYLGSDLGCIHQTTDGEYFITGLFNTPARGETDAMLLKLNSEGNILWQKAYDGGEYDCNFNSIQKAANGGYLVGGAFSPALRNGDLWLLMLDNNGEVLWQKTYGGSGYDGVSSIRSTCDGGFVVLANTESFGAGNNDLWVLKLDSNGYIPDCNIMGNSNAIVSDTTITEMATDVPFESTSITITEANIIYWNASGETSIVCYYEDPNDIDGDGVESNPGGEMAGSMLSSSFLADGDNCSDMPNGPYLGTCTSGKVGSTCIAHAACGPNGVCSMNQEDSYPPLGNGIGDACDCEGNFNCGTDSDVDGSDAALFKGDFGRSVLVEPCTGESPCNGDFNCDGDADGTDASLFKADFGRSSMQKPCPACVAGEWCSYPSP